MISRSVQIPSSENSTQYVRPPGNKTLRRRRNCLHSNTVSKKPEHESTVFIHGSTPDAQKYNVKSYRKSGVTTQDAKQTHG